MEDWRQVHGDIGGAVRVRRKVPGKGRESGLEGGCGEGVGSWPWGPQEGVIQRSLDIVLVGQPWGIFEETVKDKPEDFQGQRVEIGIKVTLQRV